MVRRRRPTNDEEWGIGDGGKKPPDRDPRSLNLGKRGRNDYDPPGEDMPDDQAGRDERVEHRVERSNVHRDGLIRDRRTGRGGQTGWQMNQPDGRFAFIYILTAGTARSIKLYFQVVLGND